MKRLSLIFVIVILNLLVINKAFNVGHDMGEARVARHALRLVDLTYDYMGSLIKEENVSRSKKLERILYNNDSLLFNDEFIVEKINMVEEIEDDSQKVSKKQNESLH